MEKRAFGRHEHFGHQMFLATCKNEVDIGKMLYVAAQQGLHLWFGIVVDYLKLVESHITRQFQFFEPVEQFAE